MDGELEKLIDAMGLGAPPGVTRPSEASQEPTPPAESAPGAGGHLGVPLSEEPPARELSAAEKEYYTPGWGDGTRNAIKKLSDWHKMVADHMLMNPMMRHTERAKVFGVTQPWFSTLINTDAFRAYFADRLREHQKLVSQEIVAQASGVAKLGFEKMRQKLEHTPVSDMKMSDIVAATETSGKMLGLGYAQSGGGGTNVTVTIGAGVDPQMLAAARAKMIEVGKHHSETRDELLDRALTADDGDDPELLEWEDARNATDPS